jgi:hypothetical protein
MEGGGVLTDRDWQMLLSIPPEWDWLGDIRDYMLFPYTQKDIEQWGDSDEKEIAMKDVTKCNI